MIAEHHHWITREATRELPQDVPLCFSGLLPEVFEMTPREICSGCVVPDEWTDIEVEIFVGHMRASSFCHFGVPYSLAGDVSLRGTRTGRTFISGAQNRELRFSDRMMGLLRTMKRYKDWSWEQETILGLFKFPSVKETAEGIKALLPEPGSGWSPRDVVFFGVHTLQDDCIPHHAAGYLFAGHVDTEDDIWEVVGDLKIKNLDDLNVVLDSLRLFVQSGGNDEDVHRWLYALLISKRAIERTRRVLTPGMDALWHDVGLWEVT